MAKKLNTAIVTCEELAASALGDEAFLKELVEDTAGEDRRKRQQAAAVLKIISDSVPGVLVPYASELCDALHRPEAKTRWEVLNTLTNLLVVDTRAVDKAVSGAEASLYDEASGPARLAAFKFLARYGSTTESRAERVWPLIDDALQCYHGDSEYNDMLGETLLFAEGKASKQVKKHLADRMQFDAKNSSGLLGRSANQIVDTALSK